MLASPLNAQEGGVTFESLMEDGLRLRELGHDEEALSRFEACLRLRPDSGEAVGQVAFAEMALGRLVVASNHLSAALRAADDDWVIRNRPALEEARGNLNAQIITVAIPIEGGEVTFTESGESHVRPTPVTLRLSPGEHNFRITVPGFDAVENTLIIEAGQSITHNPPMQASVVVMHEPVVLMHPAQVPLQAPIVVDPGGYRRQAIALDVSAAVFALIGAGAGVGAWSTRSTAGIEPSQGQVVARRIFLGTAIGSAALAILLFVGARIVRAKHPRENIAASF